ncbi:hypothetical protein FB45DRAFT_1028892 [Roridomyces roridus]|uniref:Uncharacterized protein n=1 Tax=Roridomyces roridus TaxID=1738132 RepID=A0AAD7BS00_9AGAR|nr:hypothetical protein FB45DRAFT_1028892 [Roridomyces roridus]
MSSSYRKDRVHWITIHKKLPNVSMDDFKSRRELLATKFLDIPVVQENLANFNFVISNNMLDDYVQTAGLSAPNPVVLLISEVTTKDRIGEMNEDRDLQLLAQEFSDLRPGRGVSILVAASKVLVDKESRTTSSNRVHRFSILGVPEGMAPQECEGQVAAISERFTKLAVFQKNVLGRTVFATSVDNLDSAMHQLDVEVAKHTFIIHHEYENQGNMMELLNSAEYKQYLAESKKTFNTTMFCADVITMLNKN